jgi:hypothetical protein
MEVASLIFEHMGCLDFLDHVEKNRDLSSIDSALPSWVPDWTVPSNRKSSLQGGRYGSEGLPQKLLFTCGSTARCDFCFNTKTITVDGFVVGKIAELHLRFIDADPGIRIENARIYGKRIGWNYPSASEEFERHSYWLGWLGFQSSFPHPQITVGIDKHRQPTRPEAIDTTRYFAIKVGASRYLACSDGLVQPGDSVCALFGGNMPYILRPKGNSWLFIGQWQVIFTISMLIGAVRLLIVQI